MSTIDEAEAEIDVDALMALWPALDERGQRRMLTLINRVNETRRTKAVSSTGKSMHTIRPTTDDELHQWIINETGFNIPRVAVCPGHQAPFDFVADAFFERYDALFQVGSRELGKTLGVSVVNYANAETRPGCTSCTFGAIETQAQRAYDHVTSFVYTRGEDGIKRLKPQIAGVPLRKKTEWKTGSKIEIIVGTESGVNSPHPHKVHADEVDLMEERVWNQSRNMASSSSVFGERIQAQDFATSSLKSNHGLVASIMKECDEAEALGYEPPWKIYYSCVYEASEEVSECQCADENERKARLTELGRDPNQLCGCDRVVKGEWSEDNPRTLASVCKGKFFRSRGWMAHTDVKRKFRQNTQRTWESEMECRRVSVDGVYLEAWTRERFSIRGWTPNPQYGNCYTGTDWGGGAESAIIWFQGPLRMTIQVGQYVVPEGAFVVFDEFLRAGIGATKLADEVLAKEAGWRQRVPGFRISNRFADVAGRQQRDDWREHNPPLKTVWWLTSRDFDPQVTCLQGLVEDKLYWVDIDRCSRHVDDIEAWRQKNGKEVHDESSHTMAAARYGMTNVATRVQRQRSKSGSNAEPAVAQRGTSHSPVGSIYSSSGLEAERHWREQVGQTFPSSMRGPGPWR